MEPSLEKWAPDSPGDDPLANAHEMRDKGLKNFAWSFEDFLLHHCAHKYLCDKGETYYITDIAKGAMRTDVAQVKQQERWRRWVDLLERELELVAKPEVKIISIGKESKRFLNSNLSEGWRKHHLGNIIHYSPQAIPFRKRVPTEHPAEYRELKRTVRSNQILSTAKRVMKQGKMSSLEPQILTRLQSGKGLTESRKMLMFTYYKAFQRIHAVAIPP
jgi:hypothetical protein